MNKNYDSTALDGFENKDYFNNRNSINKFDYDNLFDEDKYVVEKIVRVKRTLLPNKSERWRIFQDTKTIFTLDGNKISKKEREFLKTPEGFSFLIAQGKIGIRSLNSLKKLLKEKLKKVCK